MLLRALPFFFLLVSGCTGDAEDKGDSVGKESSPVDGDGDGYGVEAGDCDDGDAAVGPAATESCDGVDNDCDGATDEAGAAGQAPWYKDADADGYGESTDTTNACAAPSGYAATGGDCDDADPLRNPGASETDCADPVDYNCDGSVGYADVDGDSFAACEECDDGEALINPEAEERCNLADDNCDGTVDEAEDADSDGFDACSDCDDTVATVRPDATETCNGVDDNCDGYTDEDAAGDAQSWYADADADGYGDESSFTVSCTAPANTIAVGGDCDDTNPSISPAATDDCTVAVDANCDGVVAYADADGDGAPACEDCDDTNPDMLPGGTEICDGFDNDCDGATDDAAATGAGTYYLDSDSDGYGDDATATTACAVPTSYIPTGGDCDDTNAAVNPGASEICNTLDDNCDGEVDGEGATDATSWYADSDGDSYGDAGDVVAACEAPSGYVADGTDCNDGSAAVSPGADEACNSLDDDCDGATDEDAADATTWYQDGDGDGYGSTVSQVSCTLPAGYTADDGDCDDADLDVSPDATELCNGVDDNCDGTTDLDATDVSTFYADDDGDGYGDESLSLEDCTAPPGYTDNADDCDDTSDTVSPGADETCNNNDDDCDGELDEDAVDRGTFYLDDDGDGYGDGSFAATACEAPAGYAAELGDCNADEPAIYPGARELCNGIDDDCDGSVDDGAGSAPWYLDADEDGYGDDTVTATGCDAPAGYIATAGDCDDSFDTVNPGADELCNSRDDDCDGAIDNGAVDMSTYTRDADGDGYGDGTTTTQGCSVPTGYAEEDGDCDDSDADFHPNAPEEDCDDPADYNCDGATGAADNDNDGWDACEECDDTDAEVSPDATEVCNNIDDDCDGTVDVGADDDTTYYADADADGFGNSSSSTSACSAPTGYVTVAGDCNDGASGVRPGATETCDGVDQDCDGSTDEGAVDVSTWYRDSDTDTYGNPTVSQAACTRPTGYVSNDDDCNDSSSTVNPGASETCNSVDDDCDGQTDESAVGASTWYVDSDADTYGNSATSQVACTRPTGYVSNDDDCNDGSAAVNPGASEVCNSIDDNCDGQSDNSASDASTWYDDDDADTYGDAADSSVSCNQPTGYVSNDDDCDDTRSTSRPGASETCDSLDNDCDGSIDESATNATTWYDDDDADTYGDAGDSAVACTQPTGYVSNDDDCNDTSAAISPADAEVFGDSLDNDCDGSVDEYTYSYSTNVQPIWNTFCTSCHGGSGGLSLSSSVSYANLVNRASTQVPSMDRIEPSSTSTSYLWHKISGTQSSVGGSGNRMPQGGAAMSTANKAIIETWILEGAPNN